MPTMTGRVPGQRYSQEVAVDESGAMNVSLNSGLTVAIGTTSISSTVAVALNGQAVSVPPVTSGGLSMYHAKALTTLNAASIKDSAGQIYHISVFNNGSTIAYLKLYNTASAPDVGSLSTVDVIMIPGNSAGAGVEKEIANGVAYSTGIGIGLTQGMSDLDKTSATASAYIVTVYYK